VLIRCEKGCHVVKSCPPTLIVGWKSDDVDSYRDSFFLDRWPHFFNLEWRGRFQVWGVWFTSRLLLQGTDRILSFWAVIGGPRYPG
jgi:hypothetical protein